MTITRRLVPAALLASTALVLAACSADAGADGGDGDASITTAPGVNVAWEDPFYSYNANSRTGAASANAIITYLTRSTFTYYDEQLELVQDESFGTYEVVSESPLQVRYTFADTARWSDGVPVGPADLLLEWAAQSGAFTDVAPRHDPETGQVLNQEAVDAGVYFDAGSPGVALIEEAPEIDGDSITMRYTRPFADWETNIDVNLPAHVVAQRALDIEDPQQATDALVEAIRTEDTEALAAIARVWSNDFTYTSLPEEELRLSSGAYVITELVEDQYMTLEANPVYDGERPASVPRITVRWIADPMAQVQALENGDVDLISPQATPDVLKALEDVGDVEVVTAQESTYEHVDLQFANGGPFDPATYGGDTATARAVRQAFLMTVPRQQIVETLIQPLDPDAEVRNSFTVVPGSPMYGTVTSANGMAEQYGEPDVAAAAQLLADAGVETPVRVRLLFAPDNPRRQDQYELIRASAAGAGFDVVPYDVQDYWGSDLETATGFYDAALFGWESASTAVTEADVFYRTGAANNFYGYSNPAVDALLDELQVTTDPVRQQQILADVEQHLVQDAFGVTIFQWPGVAAWDPSRISDVSKLPINPTIFHGYWEWEAGSEG